MRKSYLAASALTLAMMSFSTSAFAGCEPGVNCDWKFASTHTSGNMSSGYGYSSGMTGYSSGTQHVYAGTADCPAGTTPSSDGTCLMTGSTYSHSGSSYGSSVLAGGSHSGSSYSTSSYSAPSSTSSYSYSSTPLSGYSSHSSYSSRGAIATMSDAEADYKYGSGSISETYTDGSNTIVPFSTTTASLSNYRVPGMGANEFLSPTKCPVSVYNPDGGQVLGCYAVSKPVQPKIVRHVQQVQYVRPVIYVRYPVGNPCCKPVAPPPVCCKPVYRQPVCCDATDTRYGANWPRQWRSY